MAAAIGLLTASADACRQAGYAVEIVSCGGTGTFPYCAMQPGVTEVQVGGAIFSDMHYRDHYHIDFPCALTLLATVTSRPTPTRIVLDAGKKSMSGDAACRSPIGLPGVRQTAPVGRARDHRARGAERAAADRRPPGIHRRLFRHDGASA